MNTKPGDDSRIREGMRRQLQRRDRRLKQGEHHVGWKFGFGAPDSLRRLNLDAPLLGFLTDRVISESGARVSIAGWTKPIAEPEIAVRLRSDVSGRSDREAARAAISAFGPSIELADVHFPPDDIASILEANIYNRTVIPGPVRAVEADFGFENLDAHVFHNGREVAATTDPQALTGDILGNLCHAAALLALFGERLRAGDLLIMGSVVAPVAIGMGGDVRFELNPIGTVSAEIRASG